MQHLQKGSWNIFIGLEIELSNRKTEEVARTASGTRGSRSRALGPTGPPVPRGETGRGATTNPRNPHSSVFHVHFSLLLKNILNRIKNSHKNSGNGITKDRVSTEKTGSWRSNCLDHILWHFLAMIVLQFSADRCRRIWLGFKVQIKFLVVFSP